jgi:thiol-disulfide isomerase/thioredoxin
VNHCRGIRAPIAQVLRLAIAGLLAGSATRAADADTDWRAFQTIVNERPPKPLAEMTALEREQMYERHYCEMRTHALAFLENHPTDPRRWEVVLQLNPAAPRFVKQWLTDDQGRPAAEIDQTAVAAWGRKVAELHAALAAATDVPAGVRERFAVEEVFKALTIAAAAHRNGAPVDLAVRRTQLDTFAERHPTAAGGVRLAQSYMRLVAQVAPDRVDAEWVALSASPSKVIAELAAGKTRAAPILQSPLELAFTAVDGRPVDLAQLRGKIVLVDFWATWCGPCIAELPNLKRVYSAHHDRGFEIVGIALEDAKFQPGDAPGQRAEKLAKAQRVLSDFTASHAMPWPQYCDGEHWRTALAEKFGIKSVPATLLLDRQGRVVSTDVRGEKLAAEVKRMLTP